MAIENKTGFTIIRINPGNENFDIFFLKSAKCKIILLNQTKK